MAIKGDGTDDVVKHTSSITIPTNFTLAFWYKNDSAPADAATTQPFTWNSSTDRGTGLSWNHGNSNFRGSFFTGNEGSGSFTDYNLGTLNANTWYHLAFTWDGTTGRAYKDGVETDSVAGNVPTDTNETIQLFAGQGGIANFDDGEFAEVVVLDIQLSANEIAMLASGVGIKHIHPDPNDLILYWRCADTSSPQPDDSGNDRTGTVTSAPTQTDHAPVAPPFGFNMMQDEPIAAAPSANPRTQVMVIG